MSNSGESRQAAGSFLQPAALSNGFWRTVASLMACGLLALSPGVFAQAESNPNLNAQLLVAARQGQVA
jgi:hypothetical protein